MKILWLLLAVAAPSWTLAGTISTHQNFQEWRFRGAVSRAMQQVEKILDTERNPRLAEAEDHAYNDKYTLTEFITNTAIAAQWSALRSLMGDQEIDEILQWFQTSRNKKKAVTLRFEAQDNCTLIKEEEAEIVDRESHSETEQVTVSPSGSILKPKKKIEKTKIVRKVKQYHWNVGFSYRLKIYAGSNPDDEVLWTFDPPNVSGTLVTNSDRSPIPSKTVHNPIEVSIFWILQMISPAQDDDKDKEDAGSGGSGRIACQFAIDRSSETCKTPRRNENVDAAMVFYSHIYDWSSKLRDFLVNRLGWEIVNQHKPIQTPSSSMPSSSTSRKPQLHEVTTEGIFVPVLPLMENQTTLSSRDVEVFLGEHTRTIEEAIGKLSDLFAADEVAADDAGKSQPQQSVMVSHNEAKLVLICRHMENLAVHYFDSVGYVENMLKNQLSQAIGKEITPADFGQFVRFHFQTLFALPYAPKVFSHVIRRQGYSPDGILSIEDGSSGDDQQDVPVQTMARHIPAGNTEDAPAIRIPINAATEVEITGDRYLHGWMQHHFQEYQGHTVQLAARARQFSSFLLVLGNMAGPDRFHPKHAIILQNKDQVLIPLLSKVLPSAKEFKDSIRSLSPEQQDFAKAFRSMQLESSVFAVAVIQLKPQLEKLLGLPPGALTKEIQLTQDLMSLFVDYQIPSDLLSFDGSPEETSVLDKVAAVKAHAKAVMDVIDKTKEQQLAEEKRKAEMHKAWRDEGADERRSRPMAHVQQQQQTGSAREVLMFASAASDRGFDEGSVRAAASSYGSRNLRSSGSPSQESSHTPPETTTTPGQDGGATSRSGDAASSQQQQHQIDFTAIPKVLDSRLEMYDTEGFLRPATIEAVTNQWTRMRQENLLKDVVSSRLPKAVIDVEKKKAFDLLDALSRSGSLPIDASELHVIVGVAHCFENSIIETIIEENINPIVKLEKSALLLASTIYGKPGTALLPVGPTRERLAESLPAALMEMADSAAVDSNHQEDNDNEDEK